MVAVVSVTTEDYPIKECDPAENLSNQDLQFDETSLEVQTDKKGIIIASLVMFIAAIENTVVGMSEWPYMNQIDKKANAQFFGSAIATSKFFHAISALVFAIWCHRFQSFRTPLITGRAIAFGACLLYLCVEMFDNRRRYVMAFCYVLFGIASSSSTILRSYVAAISSHTDRPLAYSGLQAANMISIIVGPLIQAAFSSIHYPGYEIFPNVKFHIYSAPIWVAASTNFISVAIIHCFLKELPTSVRSEIKNHDPLISLSGVKHLLKHISQMNLNWGIVALCWIEKMTSTLSTVTLTTLITVIFMTNYGWSGAKTVLAMSITMGAVGIFAVSVTSLYFFCHLGKLVQQRIAFLTGLIIFISMYLVTYPWPSVSNRVPSYNSTADVGCNPAAYEWCDTSHAPAAPLLLIVIACVMGIGIPLSSIALDAIYSKTLGSINQSVMQGAIIVAEDVVLIFGPIYASGVYTHFGFETLWKYNGIIVLIGALLWMAHWKKLAKFS